MNLRLIGGLLLAGPILFAPCVAEAGVRLGIGGNYWFSEAGLFDGHVAVDTRLAGPLHIGGRFGAGLVTEPATVFIPIDMELRVDIQRRLYIEGVGGPWIFPDSTNDHLRGHIAFGFGLYSGNLRFGLNVGWLEPRAHLGIVLDFNI